MIIAAVDESDPDHEVCHALLGRGRFVIHGHALTECFSILTGRKLGVRGAAPAAAAILRSLSDRLSIIFITEEDLLRAYEESSDRGIRGGAIADYPQHFTQKWIKIVTQVPFITEFCRNF